MRGVFFCYTLAQLASANTNNYTALKASSLAFRHALGYSLAMLGQVEALASKVQYVLIEVSVKE